MDRPPIPEPLPVLESAPVPAGPAPGSNDPGMPVWSGQCADCGIGTRFHDQSFHDKYVRMLGLVCGDNLSHGRRCRTYTQCQHKYYICPDFNSPNGCQFQDWEHDYNMHLARRCPKKLGEGDCGKFIGDKRAQPCFQRIPVLHVLRTCFFVLHGRECPEADCRYGHDHPEIRREVDAAREHDAKVNESKPRGA